MGHTSSELEKAFSIVDSILPKETEFYRITGHHLGVFTAHSELWCTANWKLNLQKSDVSRAIDATATNESPWPLKGGDGIQIKSRGDQGSMHIDTRIQKVDWLAVIIYDSYTDATSFRKYLFKMTDLCSLGEAFSRACAGEEQIPLRRFSSDGELKPLRLEWGILFCRNKSGRVRGTADDSWEDRYRRADEVLKIGYEWNGTAFEQGIRNLWV
jgi:hypothetical protein